jgi:hypothetical protein
MPRAAWWRRHWQQRLVKLRSSLRKASVAESLIPVPRRYDRLIEMDFGMHWGHARVRPRYAEAVAAKAQGAPRPVTV